MLNSAHRLSFIYGHTAAHTLLKRHNSATTISDWQTRNDRLGWLWSLLDVFLPQLYPAGYVTNSGTSDNPCGESYSAADNERFISTNMREMNRLREKFSLADTGTRTPILPFWWQHMCDGATKLCHNNMSVWMSDIDIQQHFDLTANSSDGMILWGDPFYFGYIHEDQGAQINKSLADLTRYKASLKHHCSLKTDDTVSPPVTNCTATCTCAFGPKAGRWVQCGIPLSTTLPSIMLLSDSIGVMPMGYYTNVVALFGYSSSSVTGAGAVGNVEVYHSRGMGKKICGTSFGPAACIDFWFSGGGKSPANKYDVIYFNWGLHDIDANACAAVTPEQYAANMEEIYLKMKRYLIAGWGQHDLDDEHARPAELPWAEECGRAPHQPADGGALRPDGEVQGRVRVGLTCTARWLSAATTALTPTALTPKTTTAMRSRAMACTCRPLGGSTRRSWRRASSRRRCELNRF